MRFESLDGLLAAPPADLGSSGWSTVEEGEVSAFVEATGSGQRGRTMPPLMLLSLTNRFLPELLEVPAASSGVNYGADSVRFGPPVPAGSRLRASARLTKAQPVAGGVQTTVEITLHAEGGNEAACVVESLSRWLE